MLNRSSIPSGQQPDASFFGARPTTTTTATTNPTADMPIDPARQHGAQIFDALRTTTATPAQVAYTFPATLTFDAATFTSYELPPRDRLGALHTHLDTLQQNIGQEGLREVNEKTLQSMFEMLSSLEMIGGSFPPRWKYLLQQMCNQCDQPPERKKWQQCLDEMRNTLLADLAVHPSIAAVGTGTPYTGLREQWALAQPKLRAHDFAAAAQHLNAMSEIAAEISEGATLHPDLQAAIWEVIFACMDRQMPTDQVTELQRQIDLLPDDAPAMAATTTQAPPAASTQPTVQRRTTADQPDIRWPEGHMLPVLLEKLKSEELAQKTRDQRRAYVSSAAHLNNQAAENVLRFSRQTPEFQRAVASLCMNVHEPTHVDITALANNQTLLNIYAHQQAMEVDRQDDGRLPWLVVSTRNPDAAGWRTLIWGEHIPELSIESIRQKVEQSGRSGVLLSSLGDPEHVVRDRININSGTFIRWTDAQGSERVALRDPPIALHEIRDLILKRIDDLPPGPFTAADVGGLGLNLHHGTITQQLQTMSKRKANPQLLRHTGRPTRYEKIPDPAMPPAKRIRLA